MTLNNVADWIPKVRQVVGDTNLISFRCDWDGVRVQMDIEDLQRLFVGRECAITDHAGRTHYAVKVDRCTFVAVGPVVLDRTTVTL